MILPISGFIQVKQALDAHSNIEYTPACSIRQAIKMKTTIRFSIFLSFFLSSPVFAQGSLEPAEPPGPTMKTLDQVEPRSPVSEAGPIEASGSYYLTNDITGAILVGADNVDLDLNGFTLSGAEVNGIEVGGRTNVKIFNGTIQGSGTAGVAGGNVADIHVDNVRIRDSGLCVNFFLPLGLVKVSQVSCKSTTEAGIQVFTNNDQPIIAYIHDNIVSFTGTNPETTRAAIRIVNVGTEATLVDIRNNLVFGNEVGIGVIAGDEGSLGTIVDNTIQGNDLNGLITRGDFVIARNISTTNDGDNFDMLASPNAAPVTAINNSPEPWDNITNAPPPPD